MYIIFEGIDTTGKSTQASCLEKSLENVILTKEPYDQSLRKMLLDGYFNSKEAEMFMFLADRSEHFENIVKPNLISKIIVSDRGFISGVAYAMANGNDNIEELINLNKIALQNSMPNKVIIFTTNYETLKSRINQKNQDAIEKRGLEYLLSVQENMIKVVKMMKLNYITVDSTKSIEDISNIVLEYIKER
jgi:dTMP kinase